MIDSFYSIKPLEDWLTTESGLIYKNEDAFVSLNVVPSTFGHSLVIPKRVVYKATQLSPEELWNLEGAKEQGLERLHYLVTQDPEHISSLYLAWASDTALNKALPCRERIEAVMGDLERGEFTGEGNIFENVGEKAGQMVRHYHKQIVPRHRPDLSGGGEAFFQYLHS
jgi:diadenosine tetraphosphate (Ap4A) HIT family hydrolase